jgi:hypothetical protein
MTPELLLRVNVRCTELPGSCFDDPYDAANPRRDSIHLAIQKGRDVVDAVPADRKEAKFVAEFRVGKRKDGAPNFAVLGPFDRQPATVGNGSMSGFSFDTRAEVDAFHAKALEVGGTDELFSAPKHTYTAALLSAQPEPDPRTRARRIVLQGDVPSPVAPPSGCRGR